MHVSQLCNYLKEKNLRQRGGQLWVCHRSSQMQKQKTIQNGVNGTTTKAWVLNALCTGRWQNNCAEKYNTQLHVKIKIKLTQAWDHSKTNKYGCCMTILQQLPQSRNKKYISTVLCTGTIRVINIVFFSIQKATDIFGKEWKPTTWYYQRAKPDLLQGTVWGIKAYRIDTCIPDI